MTPQEMIDVITAFRDGKPVETNDGGLDWWPVLSPQFNFHRYSYRVKPPELRPHWPAVVASSKPDGTIVYSVSNMLFAKPEDLIGKDGALRLATEYPPVMLP